MGDCPLQGCNPQGLAIRLARRPLCRFVRAIGQAFHGRPCLLNPRQRRVCLEPHCYSGRQSLVRSPRQRCVGEGCGQQARSCCDVLAEASQAMPLCRCGSCTCTLCRAVRLTTALMSRMPRTTASLTWRRGAASRYHHVFRTNWASRSCKQLCSTHHFVSGISNSSTSLSAWAQVLSQRCWIRCAMNASLPAAVPHGTMPPVATVAPSLAATLRALSGSVQYTSICGGWHAWGGS